MIAVGEEVKDALTAGNAVVALESTIFSTLGLPAPANEEALQRCLSVIRHAGAVPALTAVLDGVICAGIPEEAHERVLGSSVKVAARDLATVGFRNLPEGATTVSASVVIADAVGIEVFATGGMLLKPSMDHMETWPNFYEDGITYRSHNWNIDDLENQIERSLANEQSRRVIAKEGHQRYIQHTSDPIAPEIFAKHLTSVLST